MGDRSLGAKDYPRESPGVVVVHELSVIMADGTVNGESRWAGTSYRREYSYRSSVVGDCHVVRWV